MFGFKKKTQENQKDQSKTNQSQHTQISSANQIMSSDKTVATASDLAVKEITILSSDNQNKSEKFDVTSRPNKPKLISSASTPNVNATTNKLR